MLHDKQIILGISGGISAYKVTDWVREIQREGAEVQVVMTSNASQFVAPLTLAALSGKRVYDTMFDPVDAEQIHHINLLRNADLILIAPATAQTIARLAHGMADDLLAAMTLAADLPVIVCPAMNSKMFTHPATQNNLEQLRSYGYKVIEPDSGDLACREEGPGRLPEWSTVREVVLQTLSRQDLAGHTVLITAGPTREPIDPVRYLSNRSSGKMGYALARTALRRGAKVILVSGPTSLPPPPGVEFISVISAEQMAEAVLSRSTNVSVIVKAAAVADFRPSESLGQKIKKGQTDRQLKLTATRDILKILGEQKKESGKFPLLIGFAAESEDLLAEGRRKLHEKNLDLLAANDITSIDAGFDVDTNRVVLLDRDDGEEHLPLAPKEQIADLIWNRVSKILDK